MPKPYIFASRIELIELLQGEENRSAARAFFAARSATPAEVVCTGVGGNTFRAFRNLPVPPSVAFREWATSHIQGSLDTVLGISEQKEYSAYVHESANLLCARWQELTNSEMGYGRGAKLFNLVLKKLACLCSLSEEQRQALIPLLHVPLDSYTIVGLRAIAPEFSIPRSATMKWVESPHQYTSLQTLISQLSQEARVPSIYYDILAWDKAH
jgi:hypothetical protein